MGDSYLAMPGYQMRPEDSPERPRRREASPLAAVPEPARALASALPTVARLAAAAASLPLGFSALGVKVRPVASLTLAS